MNREIYVYILTKDKIDFCLFFLSGAKALEINSILTQKIPGWERDFLSQEGTFLCQVAFELVEWNLSMGSIPVHFESNYG